jgi:hypothetical protein
LNKTEIKDVGVKKVIIHEDFNALTLINDIAPIELNETLVETDTIGTICLPINETQIIDNLSEDQRILTIAGWGRTESSTTGSDVLVKGLLKYVPNDVCNEFPILKRRNKSKNVTIEDTQMCAKAHGDKKIDA